MGAMSLTDDLTLWLQVRAAQTLHYCVDVLLSRRLPSDIAALSTVCLVFFTLFFV